MGIAERRTADHERRLVSSAKKKRERAEAATATAILAGINMAIALSFLLRGRGAFRLALDDIGILEEWSAALMVVSGIMLFGSHYPKSPARPWGFILNVFVLAATYCLILVFSPGLAFSSIGLVIVICAIASMYLLWFHERGNCVSQGDGG